MSIPQIPTVLTLRERVAAAVAARRAEERERAEAAERDARGDAIARLRNRLCEILGIEMAWNEPLDWSGWPAAQPKVTVERVTFQVNLVPAWHSWHLVALCPTKLPLEEWVPIRSLEDLGPILEALDAAEARS